MRLVLDTSATLAWILDDELSDAARRLFDAVAEEGALVPALWRLEIANSLTVAMRRGRIDADFRNAALRDLALLDIAIDPDTAESAWTTTLALADRYHLTLYDAAYVDLAQRRSLSLASLDREQCDAARAIGVALFPMA